MLSTEASNFLSIMVGLCDYYQRPALKEMTLAIYWDGLSAYSLDDVTRATRAHIADPVAGQYFPKVADLTRHIKRAEFSGIPQADEAWAICYRITDERQTVVITDTMRDAWAIAWPVLEAGDEVGARVAFKAAYSRAMASLTEPPRWEVQLGSCPQLRAQAILSAVEAGQLQTHALSVHQLPAPTRGVSGLLENANSKTKESKAHDAVKAIQRMLRGEVIDPEAEERAEIARREAQRKTFEDHKAAELSRLAEFGANISPIGKKVA